MAYSFGRKYELQQLLGALEAKLLKSAKGKKIEESNREALKIKILEIIDHVLASKLEASKAGNKSFSNPFIIRCLNNSYYETEEIPEGTIVSNIGTIHQLLSSLIYGTRLYIYSWIPASSVKEQCYRQRHNLH